MLKVYINSLGKFLPGEPIKNSEIDQYIGNNRYQSRNKALVLRQNKIKTRYYALDKNGRACYSNASMAAQAIKTAIEQSEVSLSQISFLASSTTLGVMWSWFGGRRSFRRWVRNRGRAVS